MSSSDSLFSTLSTSGMSEIFSLRAQLRAMVRFEAALAGALEAAGIAAKGSADPFEPLEDAQFLDIPSLLSASTEAGNLAIPFVRQLTSAVRAGNEAAARWIHYGATSQDVLDTALVLQIRDALAAIDRTLDALTRALAQQVRNHAGAVMLGRTWLQPGPPVTLGLKLAGTLAALHRHRERLRSAADAALVLQFGGAVGTLASLGPRASDVSAELARRLDLREPSIPWHTQRDSLVHLAQTLALLTASLGKFARDMTLLMQAEVAEAFEPAAEGRGGSSAMPHKRNPVLSARVLTAAAQVPGLVATLLCAVPQEHERSPGLWQAEWDTIPAIFRLTAAALTASLEIAEGLQVDSRRMRANLDATRGLALSESVSAALADTIGLAASHELVRRAALQVQQSGESLASVLLSMPEVTAHLSEAEIHRLRDPDQYLGSAQRFIEQVLKESDARR
jgi:3-carboxy-cis,cis-muconate cycloisomerase